MDEDDEEGGEGEEGDDEDLDDEEEDEEDAATAASCMLADDDALIQPPMTWVSERVSELTVKRVSECVRESE